MIVGEQCLTSDNAFIFMLSPFPCLPDKRACLTGFTTSIFPKCYYVNKVYNVTKQSLYHYYLPLIFFFSITLLYSCRQCRHCRNIDKIRVYSVYNVSTMLVYIFNSSLVKRQLHFIFWVYLHKSIRICNSL